jgi:hypothetical protein
MEGHDQTRNALLSELRGQGYSVSEEALKPLEGIDFKQLVGVLDHEEHFLRTVFINNLVGLRRAQPLTAVAPNTITAQDVETALRMLGTAAARQDESTLSAATKEQIKNACPYC